MLDSRKFMSLAFVLVLLSSAMSAMAQNETPTTAPETPAATPPTPAPTPEAAPVPSPATPGDNDVLGSLERRIELQRTKAKADIEDALKRADETAGKATRAEDYQAAQDAVDLARNTLQANKGVFEAADFTATSDTIEDRANAIRRARESWEIRRTSEIQRDIDAANTARVIEAQDALRRKVQGLMSQATAFSAERKFKQAMDVMDQILKLEPTNRWALQQRVLLEQIDLMARERDNLETRNIESAKTLVELKAQEIPWYDLVRYPKNWQEMTSNRDRFSAGSGAGGETEVDRATLQRLNTTRIDKTSFDGFAFGDVITWLATNARVNIHVKWSVLEAVSPPITADTKIRSATLIGVTAEKALRTVLEDIGGSTTQLDYIVEDGVVTVSTKDDLATVRYRKTLVYDIRDLIFTLKSFNGPKIDLSAMTTGVSGNNDSGGSTSIFGNGTSNNNTSGEATRDAIVKMIMDLITTTIDPTSWRGDAGGDIGSIRELNGQLVVTQTAANHRALLDLINRLREAKNIQVSIETRFVEVRSDFLNSVGLDLQMFFNIGSTLRTSPGTIDPVTGARVASRSGYPWTGAGTVEENGPGNNRLTPVGIQQDSWTWARNPGTNLGTQTSTPALRVAGSFLDDIQVDFLMEATQAQQTSRLLTAPRLTLFNGQKAYIAIASFDAYVAGYSSDANANDLTPIVRWLPSGSVLSVEATVSADRRYVTLTMSPSLTQSTKGSPVYLSSGGGGSNSYPLWLPSMTTQAVETIVSIPDGGTLLLGGQNSSNEIEREKGVPLLNKVPILDRLFDNRSKGRDERVVLILVKPKIIIQQEEEETAFP